MVAGGERSSRAPKRDSLVPRRLNGSSGSRRVSNTPRDEACLVRSSLTDKGRVSPLVARVQCPAL